MSREMKFNIFAMSTVSHMTMGLWRHPENKAVHHDELETWVELAKLAERGRFDAIFIADGVGLGGEFGGSWDIYPERGILFPASDPLMMISAMAHATEHLGFIFTSSIIQHPPFSFARSVSTLDHLTKGRVGWNIVTSSSPNAHKNVGLDGLVEHDERYAMADEYVDVAYKLWEASWKDGAVVRNTEENVYADPSKVHKINHEGKYYHSEGPSIVAPSPQRTPVLFQAGSSDTGREFAARHAEGVFILADTPQEAAPIVADLRRRAVEQGRRPEDLQIFAGLSFIVGSTMEEAQAKVEEFASYRDPVATMVHRGAFLGIDFASTDPDTPLREVLETAPSRALLTQFIESYGPDANPTVRDLAEDLGAKYEIVGTPESIADELEEWGSVGVDGINIISIVTPGTYEDFIDLVVPVLQERGLMKREYAPGTFREKVTQSSSPYIQSPHPAAQLRG